MNRFAAVAAAALALSGCTKPLSFETYCTEEFRVATVTVLDGTGAAVSGATVTPVVKRTGDTLVANMSLALWAPGTYPIVDDSHRAKLRATGDTVNVSVSSAQGSASGKYYFTVPEGCHIHKWSGPDTLIVQ